MFRIDIRVLGALKGDPMTKTGYNPRYRTPTIIIRCAVLLHMFLPSRNAKILLFFLFGAKVSHKTICEWTNKFYHQVEPPLCEYSPTEILICHVDEKYVKIQGEWHYWWSLKDCYGNIIHNIITEFRDFASAKNLLIESRKRIGRNVDILIRDGLFAYEKATKYLGRKCKSIISGINGKLIFFKKKVYWLTNNTSESLNSEIDFYMRRFQNNFANLQSANKFANIFMLQKYFKKCFNEKKFSEASSLLIQAITI